MNAPRRNILTHEDGIIIDWTALASPQNGDFPISAYNLQWFKDNTWQDLYGILPGAYLTQFTLTSDIQRGETYEFRLRAFNIYEWGAWSDTTLIKAAGIPFTPTPVTTSFDPITGGVILSWFAPHDNSQNIEEYFVEIQSAGLDWFEDSLHCDGT